MAYLERTNVINSAGTVINPATEETSSAINGKLPALTSNNQLNTAGFDSTKNAVNVYPRNMTTFREAFETYTPGNTWTEVKGTGDLIYVDGNAASASYLVISKDPLTANTESSVTTVSTFELPIEISTGLSMSQRTVGQEFSVEVMDGPNALPALNDITLANVFQTTTNLIVDTATAHGLSAGTCIGLRNCIDQRANYPALVVATVPSPTQFTVSAGPGGAIPSQTIYISSVIAATTAALPAATYNNGTAGVGATLTATANGVFPDQDNITIPLNGRVLVKNQAAPAENGVYVLTTVGTVSTPWVLTRATDLDTAAEMTVTAGIQYSVNVYVAQGATQAQKQFYLSATVTTVGTTAVTFVDSNTTQALGFMYYRIRLSRAENGISEIFENVTVTNASLYIRGDAGESLPSGTIAGNQSSTVGTTASVQLVNAAYQYAFAPTTEYRYFIQSDRTQWADSAVDAVAQTTNRLLRTLVCPNPLVTTYRMRFRATNNKSLTVPNAQIVSAVKTGTTTALITTDVNHGLLTGDLVVIYGIRDQAAASFPNLTTATAVTVLSPTTFNVVIGTAASVTSYGGYVAKIQGGNLMSALGAIAQAAQTAVLSTLVDGTRQLVLTGSAAWAGIVIGDLVNIIGVRDNTTGATLGVDGAWKVANIATTTLTLVLPYTASMTLPSDFALINCGGGVIKRTDLRIGFVRIFDYARERVELLSRPAADISAAAPVAIQGGTLPAVTTVTTVTAVTGITNALPAGTNALGYIGMISDTRTDLTRNTYANGIRRNMNFS